MKDEFIKELSMASRACYQIVVKGLLDDHWRDWFNGTEISLEHDKTGAHRTTLTCKLKDQSELLGILNRVNSLNLPLLEVTFIHIERNGNESKN